MGSTSPPLDARASNWGGELALQSASASRRTLAAALVGSLILLLAVTYQETRSKAALNVANQAIARAQVLAKKILLADETLTMSANMAAATGEERWIARYEATMPQIEAPIAEALDLASPRIAARFDRDTRVSHDVLVELDRQAFAHLRAGDRVLARAILDGQHYAHHKNRLARGGRQFLEALVAHTKAERVAVERRTVLARTLIIGGGLSFIAVLVLWFVNRSEREHRKVERKLRRLALSDHLTGLANRAAFERELQARLDEVARSTGAQIGAQRPPGARSALVSIDLLDFRSINELYGHHFGDLVLKAIAGRLQNTFRTAFVARVGGNEFAVIAGLGHQDLAAFESTVRSALKEVERPLAIEGTEAQVGARAGIALLETHADAVDVRRGAELALSAAKGSDGTDGSRVRIYTAAMEAAYRADLATKNEVRDALAAERFVPYFHPMVDLATGSVEGVEALARWCPEGRSDALPPSRFVAHLEAIGRLECLTWMIMSSALKASLEWPKPLPVSVNVPPTQLRDGFAERVFALLDGFGLPPQRLVIEVLETALVDRNAAAIRVLRALRASGVRIALDDFGVGYSSLGQLSNLPIDTIKIDRSFLASPDLSPEGGDADPTTSANNAAVIRAAVDLGDAFGLRVVAEGIETQAHIDMLLRIGCRFGQGFHYTTPLASADFTAYLGQRDASSRAKLVAFPTKANGTGPSPDKRVASAS